MVSIYRCRPLLQSPPTPTPRSNPPLGRNPCPSQNIDMSNTTTQQELLSFSKIDVVSHNGENWIVLGNELTHELVDGIIHRSGSKSAWLKYDEVKLESYRAVLKEHGVIKMQDNF